MDMEERPFDFLELESIPISEWGHLYFPRKTKIVLRNKLLGLKNRNFKKN